MATTQDTDDSGNVDEWDPVAALKAHDDMCNNVNEYERVSEKRVKVMYDGLENMTLSPGETESLENDGWNILRNAGDYAHVEYVGDNSSEEAETTLDPDPEYPHDDYDVAVESNGNPRVNDVANRIGNLSSIKRVRGRSIDNESNEVYIYLDGAITHVTLDKLHGDGWHVDYVQEDGRFITVTPNDDDEDDSADESTDVEVRNTIFG